MKLSQKINEIWFQVCALRGPMPQETEDQRAARSNMESVLFWLEAAQRRQERVEDGPAPKTHPSTHKKPGVRRTHEEEGP